MQRDIWAAPGVASWRQVVGVGFAINLEDGDFDLVGDFRLGHKPLSIGPGLNYALSVGIGLGFLHNIVEGIKHQQGA